MGEPRLLVLLVDDFADNREMFADYLAYSGYEVAQAGTGLEALEKALALRPDIILMDLSLPGMDGWEATRRLKKDDRTRNIPVIALTGHALRGHSEGALAAGCATFIAKPYMPGDLLKKMREILEKTVASENGA